MTLDIFTDCNMHLLSNLYTLNGECFRRQVKGLPMGLECSPQMANLYGYAIEAQWVDSKQPQNMLAKRYIDDIFVAGPDAMTPGRGIPSEEEYAMKYKVTSESPDSLLYLGVRFFKDQNGEAHCVLHDRAVDYPIQLDRYPHVSTVANPSQLGGVIMGRLVAAQRACSRMDLFQDAVAGIFTHAFQRGYSRRLVHGVWTKFLLRYWDAAGSPTKELRDWFHRTWKGVVEAEGREARAAPGRPPTVGSQNASRVHTPLTWPSARASGPDQRPHSAAQEVPSRVDDAGSSSGVGHMPHPAREAQPGKQEAPLNPSQGSTLQSLLDLTEARDPFEFMDVDDADNSLSPAAPGGALVPFPEHLFQEEQHGAGQVSQSLTERGNTATDASLHDMWQSALALFTGGRQPNVTINQQWAQVVPVDRPVPIYIPVPMPVEQRIPFPVYMQVQNQPIQYTWNQNLQMQGSGAVLEGAPLQQPQLAEPALQPRLEMAVRPQIQWQQESLPEQAEPEDSRAVDRMGGQGPEPSTPLYSAPVEPVEHGEGPVTLSMSIKRTATTLDEEEPSQCSQPSQAKRRHSATYDEHDPVMTQRLSDFKAEKDWEMRRQIWCSWDPTTRAFAMHRSSTIMRTVLKGWKKQEEREAQGRPPDPTPPGDGSSSSMNLDPPEEQSHDWKEGSRIGEAANPGPEGHNHIGSRAPNGQQEQTEAPARQHGVRAVSDSPWGHKRREPGQRYVARQATSSPPHHERATIVSKSKKQRAPWELPAPRGSGTNVQITPCKYGGSGPAPQHDGGQRPNPRELVPPPPQQGMHEPHCPRR